MGSRRSIIGKFIAESNLDRATVLKGCRNAGSIVECIYG
jgi:hypothetical protein